jgi:dienelactone hydrolase
MLSQTCYILMRWKWLKTGIKLPWEETAPKVSATLAHCVQTHPHPLSACGAVGFCWGASVTARLQYEAEAAKLPLRIVGGIGFHPSHRGWDVAQVARPLMLAPAGDDPATVHPGGQIAQQLIMQFGASMVVPFPEMKHGWMTRGPLTEDAIARDYATGMKLMVDWFAERIPGSGK